ncbi:hypothetical protein F4821DRAFT_271145 [Hypoxylon rubiginosum]|uniref:Uncharacterized protein n=1 Tax=Hypoxylon rubiginosum TaxID=110542 RepID=A0ACC0CV89_9PEZI|nr:hypothetical protein F4821DRAFT_271145 [Hypoxylon rubiginosum]
MYLNRRNNSAESNLAEVQEELEQVDEECFSWATAKLALGHITLEDYFDRLIDHIREGEARHTWDKSNSNIAHTLQGDLIAGAFKSRMLKRNLGKISHADGEQLKALYLLFYHEAAVTELQRRVVLDVGVTLTSLPPWTIDILGIIAYARRHADVLEHLVENYRASTTTAKTSFDLISRSTISSRMNSSSETFQHSRNSPHNRELEWRLWTALLKAEPGTWLHYPLLKTTNAAGIPEGLYNGLAWLAHWWPNNYELRNSPALAEYLRALSPRGVKFSPQSISQFLSVTAGTSINFCRDGRIVPVSAAAARTMLECFPLEGMLSDDRPDADSAELALPITQWPTNNPDRLVVMEMLLEQGLLVDGNLAYYRRWNDGSGISSLAMRTEEQLQDTCLIKAAERGDTKMVELLVRYGAKRDVRGAHGYTAAERARMKGHPKIAKYLETLED